MNLTGYHYLSSMPLSVDINEGLVSYKKRVSDGALCPLLSDAWWKFLVLIIVIMTCRILSTACAILPWLALNPSPILFLFIWL